MNFKGKEKYFSVSLLRGWLMALGIDRYLYYSRCDEEKSLRLKVNKWRGRRRVIG